MASKHEVMRTPDLLLVPFFGSSNDGWWRCEVGMTQSQGTDTFRICKTALWELFDLPKKVSVLRLVLYKARMPKSLSFRLRYASVPHDEARAVVEFDNAAVDWFWVSISTTRILKDRGIKEGVRYWLQLEYE